MTKVLLCCLCVFLCLSCTEPPDRKPGRSEEKPPLFERVEPTAAPDFGDDSDRESIRKALEKSLEFYGRIPEDRTYPLGDMTVTARRLRETLVEFLRLLDAKRLDRHTIAEKFVIYRASGTAAEAKPLVTGYYEPVLEGRLEANREFCYPLYGVPSDLLTIDLGLFDPTRYPGQRLVGRVKDKLVVPYYSRDEIDGQKKLGRSAAALAWLRDPLDAFFLHIQGSGVIRLPDGRSRRVGYAGANGRPYRSVGKVLIDMGVLTPEETTLQSIRSVLSTNPQIRDEVLRQNESYVFFRWVQEGPLGSLNVTLTSGRSIASDPLYHPRGAIAFLVSKKPRIGADGEVLDWENLHRWVFNQDAGGAIKGIGRVDLFCGSGEAAGWMAGRMKHPGELYFILKRDGSSEM